MKTILNYLKNITIIVIAYLTLFLIGSVIGVVCRILIYGN
jgi:hypothetical protein